MDYKFTNLQVGDNDLIGNKFNGHDLHLYLREQRINAFHYVHNKESDDGNTFVYSNIGNGTALDLIKSRWFIESDIVHLHLIHNTNFDISYLPLMTSLKPTVITLHDAFFLAGHCLHSEECEKWKNICFDCDRMNTPKFINKDETALLYEIKRQAFQNSNISLIVASDFMFDRVRQAPIMSNKKIFKIPFGVNGGLFKPYDTVLAKSKLGIDKDQTVLMFRSTPVEYKGGNLLKDCFRRLPANSNLVILTVDSKGLLDEFVDKFKIVEYGWVKDDVCLANLYQACDLFLMPSEQEGFGMMAIEAMSCGKPVLSTKGTALEGVTNAPYCGVCVSRQDYYDTLVHLIYNPEELTQRGELSLKFAKENYSKEVYVERMIQTYETVMQSFTPGENATLILRQLLKHSVIDLPSTIPSTIPSTMPSRAIGPTPENDNEPVVDDYTKTLSWRITKPLRIARKTQIFYKKYGSKRTIKAIWSKMFR